MFHGNYVEEANEAVSELEKTNIMQSEDDELEQGFLELRAAVRAKVGPGGSG